MHYENKLELEVMFVFWRVMLWSWILLFALILILHEKSLPSYLTFTTSFLVSQLQITNFYKYLGEFFILRILISRLSHCCLCPLWALGLPFLNKSLYIYIYKVMYCDLIKSSIFCKQFPVALYY